MINNNCGCNTTPACPIDNCACPVLISSDCVSNFTEDLICANILKGQTLTEVVVKLDEYICERFTSVEEFIKLINVGAGSQIYKGDTLLGKKQLRTLVDSGLINIVQATDTITISVDEIALNTFIEVNQKTYSALSVGLGAEVYKSSTVLGDNTQFNVRKIKSSNSSVSIIQGTDDIDITVAAGIVPDGSETKVTAGTNVTITGAGTTATPYVVSSTYVDTNTTYSAGAGIALTGTVFSNTAQDQVVSLAGAGATVVSGTYPNFTITSTDTNTPTDGSETKITAGTNVIVTGTGTTSTPYIVNTTTPDGSETKINSGVTTVVTGIGSIVSPYIVETVNLQKIITTNYTLVNGDNNFTMIINNATVPVTITVPISLTTNFQVGFIQQGTADVNFLASGTSINTPAGLKIKGQNFNAYVEKVGTTEVFHLLGNLKV